MDEQKLFLPHQVLQVLIDDLTKKGFQCIGPQVQSNTIVYAPLKQAQNLPWGVRDKQGPGRYELAFTEEKKAFLFSNGPEAIKPLVFSPQETVWKVVRNEQGKLIFEPSLGEIQPIALIGARACDLAALAIQDKVFLHGKYQDKSYQSRREQLLIIAVNCSVSSANCFCVSAGTGVEVQQGYDLLMTEITDGFVIQAGSASGQAILSVMRLEMATLPMLEAAKKSIQQAIDMQTKTIPLNNQETLRDALFERLEHPHWKTIADKCLSCGNCTSVCPTCFCYRTEEKQSLGSNESHHVREWDSCFTAEHSYVGGQVLRQETEKRYRQWLTHKVGSWFDQFGESGCVGCGRCISWCPVGIDFTEELALLLSPDEDKS